MTDCLFCKIVAGEIPCRAVYEDDDALAFLDIAPLSKGHTLVLPKRHVKRSGDLSEDEHAALFARVHRVQAAVLKAVGRKDALVAVHDGPEAGQEVPHLHVHVIPRRHGDGAGAVHSMFSERAPGSDEVLTDIAEAVKARL